MRCRGRLHDVRYDADIKDSTPTLQAVFFMQ